MNEEQQYLNFEEYIKASEPHKRERAEAWRVAIGLQAIKQLKTAGVVIRDPSLLSSILQRFLPIYPNT